MSGDSANNPGYLVLMKCSASTLNGSKADDACIGWTGDTIYVKPTAETTISLSQIEVRLLINNCQLYFSMSHFTHLLPVWSSYSIQFQCLDSVPLCPFIP